MAFTGVAALFAAIGTETVVTAAMVLSAVTEVGMALTVVGAVTGNKTLIKVGGAMSLIGGVGGMIAGSVGAASGAASSAATTGTLSEAATASALESASADAAAAYGGTAGAELANAATVAGMEGGASGLGSALADGGIVQGSTLSAGPGADLGADLGPKGIGDTALKAAGPDLGPQGPGSIQAPGANVGDVSTPTVDAPGATKSPYDITADARSTPTDLRLNAGTQQLPSSQTAPIGASSYFNALSQFAEKNKTLFSSGLQLLGGAMKGANDSEMWNQKMDLERAALAQRGHGNEIAMFQPRGIVQGARA